MQCAVKQSEEKQHKQTDIVDKSLKKSWEKRLLLYFTKEYFAKAFPNKKKFI